MKPNSRVWVAGSDTLLGAALVDRLQEEEFEVIADLPDLTIRAQVEDFVTEVRPDYVFVAAGQSGGIGWNQAKPASLMLDNLLVASHVLEAARLAGVRKLIYLASSCSYPRHAPQPMSVESLGTGPLEPTNAAYATAKLAGIQLCQAYRQQFGVDFISAIPANAFGPYDDFDPIRGHVIPALIARCHRAKIAKESVLTIWGSGKPRREFVYSVDLADACTFTMRRYSGEAPINLGGLTACSIAEIAQTIVEIVGYEGELRFDTTKPDGMPIKMLDSSPLKRLGWQPFTDVRTALTETYHWFLQHEVTEDHEHECSTVSLALPNPPHRRGDRTGISDG